MKLGWEATGSGVMCEGFPYNYRNTQDVNHERGRREWECDRRDDGS